MKDLTPQDTTSLPVKRKMETEDKIGYTVWLGGAAAWGGYNVYAALSSVSAMLTYGATFTSVLAWTAKMLALTGGIMLVAPMVWLVSLSIAGAGTTGEGADARKLGWFSRLMAGASAGASSYAVYHAICVAGAQAGLEAAWVAYQLPWLLVLGSLVATTLVAAFGGAEDPQRVRIAQKTDGTTTEVPEQLEAGADEDTDIKP